MEKIVQVNEEMIRNQLGDLVRNSVEETLNGLLDAEADRICNAQRYEHTDQRKDTRAGFYERDLQTRAGEVKLKVPKLRHLPFETAIVERYKRREISIEEAMIEMYMAGVSVRRVEDITEALWGTRVSAGTVSSLNQKAYEHIEQWRMRPISGNFPYVYVDGIWLKRSWGGEVTNVAVLVAIGVDEDGFRDIIGAAEGGKEDKESWLGFLRYLKERGLQGTQLFVSDKCLGLIEALGEVFPQGKWQRCVVHFYRNVFKVVSRGKMKEVAAILKAIHAQEDKAAAKAKAAMAVEKLRAMKLSEAASIVEMGIDETLTYMDFPREHWIRIRTNNALERILREVRRRTRVVGNFPDGRSALMLVCARLRYIVSTAWGDKRYLNMKLLIREPSAENIAA
jgi:putative transposase